MYNLYHLYSLKNKKEIHGGVLLLVTLKVTLPQECSHFFKLDIWFQIVQIIACVLQLCCVPSNTREWLSKQINLNQRNFDLIRTFICTRRRSCPNTPPTDRSNCNKVHHSINYLTLWKQQLTVSIDQRSLRHNAPCWHLYSTENTIYKQKKNKITAQSHIFCFFLSVSSIPEKRMRA